MAGRPLLLVDIDGVLNVFGVDACPNGYAEHAVFPEDDQPMRSATIHGVWLRDPAGAFDLAWASAWGFQAQQHLGPILDLEEFPFVPMPEIPSPPAERVPERRHVDQLLAWARALALR